MSWRVVIVRNKAKLDYKMDYLVVRSQKENLRIHISEISTLVIESTAVSLTAYLLAELVKNKVKIIFCDDKKNPLFEASAYYGAHDTVAKIRTQIKWESNIKDLVWAEIVRAKILGQRSVLPKGNDDERRLFELYSEQVEAGDVTNREGHAAKVYFNRLFGNGFSRSDNNYINAALNYGYGILLSAFNREIVAAGYITQVGIHHDNMFNQFNLSCDLMEPFRPFVDKEVVGMQLEKFESEEKTVLINLLNKEILFDGKHHVLLTAVRLYSQSVFHALNEREISKIKFPSYEQ